MWEWNGAFRTVGCMDIKDLVEPTYPPILSFTISSIGVRLKVKFRVWVNDNIYIKIWYVITDSCRNPNCCLAELLVKFAHGWSQPFIWITYPCLNPYYTLLLKGFPYVLIEIAITLLLSHIIGHNFQPWEKRVNLSSLHIMEQFFHEIMVLFMSWCTDRNEKAISMCHLPGLWCLFSLHKVVFLYQLLYCRLMYCM